MHEHEYERMGIGHGDDRSGLRRQVEISRDATHVWVVWLARAASHAVGRREGLGHGPRKSIYSLVTLRDGDG